ncbi:MAG TPA: EamA family transporter [Phycisphaerae bacterium]|nr:EamA family transporter [Phycisphaerae bacterium]HRW54985.1 EamA family transporter [Phycisphaerae bacterium]
MKIHWLWFVLGTVIFWGTYIPTLHQGQLGFKPTETSPTGPLRAFMFVGVAYFLMAIIVPGILIFVMKREPTVFPMRGILWSTGAGVLGSLGALCIILALVSGGGPTTVPPLVFAGAPVMSVVIAMLLSRPQTMPSWQFYVGILMAAAGVALVLHYKPR